MNRVRTVGLTLDVPGRRLLDGLDLMVDAGECVAIMGPSGSGKTSLLNCLCGITQPSAGTVFVDDVDVSGLGTAARAAFRLRHVGLVFQFGELLPELTVIENVALPLRLLGVGRVEAEHRATQGLREVGVDDHGAKHPDALSGGEMQRAGIARALSHAPKLVLADEPTGALDEANAAIVTELLSGAARKSGSTVIIATHDPLVAAMADRVYRLRGGRLDSTAESRPNPVSIERASATSRREPTPDSGLEVVS